MEALCVPAKAIRLIGRGLWIESEPSTGGERQAIIRWRAWHPMTHGYLEVRWDPREGQIFDIRDVGDATPEVRSTLASMIDRMRDIRRPWRPNGRSMLDFETIFNQEIAHLRAKNKNRPLTKEQVAARLSMHPSTLDDYLGDFGLTWTECKRRGYTLRI